MYSRKILIQRVKRRAKADRQIVTRTNVNCIKSVVNNVDVEVNQNITNNTSDIVELGRVLSPTPHPPIQNYNEPSRFSDLFQNNDKEYNTNLNSGTDETDNELEINQKGQSDEVIKQLREFLGQKFVADQVTTGILKILRQHPCFSQLPCDARTFLGKIRNIPVIDMAPGEYCHFGFSDSLQRILGNAPCISVVELSFNIDGMPVTKSSGKSFWPILCSVVGVPESVFEVGIYCGVSKPDINDFLKRFVTELNALCQRGLIIYSRKEKVKVKIKNMICDCPGRSYVLNTKGHTGKHGCGKCVQEGVHLQKRMTFPLTDSPLRTDKSFRDQLHPQHHHGTTDLKLLPMDMVASVPYEFMHLVCLGVMRKLLYLWTIPKLSSFGLPVYKRLELSKRLITLKPHIPMEFARKPRNVGEIKNWKATEFRQFLLYTGPLVLKKILPKIYYQHFLCLHVAISILASPSLYLKNNNYAKELLLYFVKKFGILYGEQHITYNVHGLVHLAEDSKLHGPLDEFSAFRYENHLGHLKQWLRSKNKPLQQIYNRILQKRKFATGKCEKNETKLPAIVKGGGAFSHKAVFQNFILQPSPSNSTCVLKDGRIIIVKNINATEISGRLLKRIEDFYATPCSSSLLNQFIAVETVEEVIVEINQVKNKLIRFPLNSRGKFLILPLIHGN